MMRDENPKPCPPGGKSRIHDVGDNEYVNFFLHKLIPGENRV